MVAFGAWLFGFANPVMLGILTAILNYMPYIGPACMVVILFGVGLVTFPTLGYALLPPAAFVALTTIEGHIITPTIVGRQLTLNPLLVFTAIVFWAWLWGPIGAFLAVPLSIIALVIFNHLFPARRRRNFPGEMELFAWPPVSGTSSLSHRTCGARSMSNMSNMARDTAKDARDTVKETSKAASAGAKDIQEDLEALRDDVARLTQQLARHPGRQGRQGLEPRQVELSKA